MLKTGHFLAFLKAGSIDYQLIAVDGAWQAAVA